MLSKNDVLELWMEKNQPEAKGFFNIPEGIQHASWYAVALFTSLLFEMCTSCHLHCTDVSVR